MEDAQRGFQENQDSVPEMGEDAVTSVGSSNLTEEECQELQEEMAKVEDEIQTLTQVLETKEKHLADLKRKLGVTPLRELKQNFTKTWQDVTSTLAYKRTSETLSQAGLKASAAFANMGSVITRKFEDVKNAPGFKSLDTLKTKMNPSASLEEEDGPPGAENLLSQSVDMPTQETPMN
ncbi:tumor protein D52 isoform X2 [Gouania willdenowi]|uniref:Tumor protein D52 n=2 Tax=Gouania willdenowi TaxID=441366 RepID=A0A8C5D8U6_GOUWI|nr:tumor protein D52 isoform X2 [Gouania willdenowi]